MRALSALLAVLLLCGLVSAQKISRSDRAKIRETRESMKSLQLDLSTVHQIDGKYPDSLKAVVDSKLRENIPKDAWGREFSYELSAEHGFMLKSLGADGKAGGAGGDADIVWTQAGELRVMSADERAAYQARLEAQRFQASRVVARERMIIAGAEAVSYRRTEGKWPATLADCKRKGKTETETAINACFTDPWGHEFTLRPLPKDNFAVICWGADGKEDGHGRDADFVITEREVRATYNVANDDWWGWDPWGGSSNDWRAQDLAQDVARFRERTGKLPEELSELTRAGAPDAKGEVPQAIRNNIPKDRWGNDYVYVKLNDKEFHIVGLGKDEIEGGIKDNTDVIFPEPGTDPTQLAPKDEWGDVIRAMPAPDGNAELAEVATEQLLDILDKVNAYHAEHENYPESLEDIKDTFVDEIVPTDPWGAAFIYTITKDGETVTGFTVKCLGSDSAEGGDDHAADITYNQAGEPVAE
jgi:hypothetical protein